MLFLHACSVWYICSLFGIVGVTDACLEALSKSCSHSLTTLDVNGCIGIKVRTWDLRSLCDHTFALIISAWFHRSQPLLPQRFLILWLLYLGMFDRGGAEMTCLSCSHCWVASECTASSHSGSTGFRRFPWIGVDGTTARQFWASAGFVLVLFGEMRDSVPNIS